MTVQEATSPDTWLQSRWSGTKSAVLADFTCDVQNAIETEWFDIAGRAPEGDIPAAYRLAARANQHAARRADELAGSLVNTAFDEGAIALKAR